MVDGISPVNPHQPAVQQSQAVTQPPATNEDKVQDPNAGNRTRVLLDDAVEKHIQDEAAKRQERGQTLNISV